MHLGESLVSHGQASVLRQLRERSLDYPAMSSEAFLAIDAGAYDAMRVAAHRACAPTVSVVVALVGVQLGRSAWWPSHAANADQPDRIEHRLEHAWVVHVARAGACGQRHAEPVDD